MFFGHLQLTRNAKGNRTIADLTKSYDRCGFTITVKIFGGWEKKTFFFGGGGAHRFLNLSYNIKKWEKILFGLNNFTAFPEICCYCARLSQNDSVIKNNIYICPFQTMHNGFKKRVKNMLADKSSCTKNICLTFLLKNLNVLFVLFEVF